MSEQASGPRLTVAAVIARTGTFLLVEERIGERLVLNQPAGHVEPGETLAAAVCREVLEETARPFAPEALVGVYLWQPPTGRPYLRVVFSGSCGEADPTRRLDTGIERTLWYSREELRTVPERLRSPLVLRAIDDWTAGAREPLPPDRTFAPRELLTRATRV